MKKVFTTETQSAQSLKYFYKEALLGVLRASAVKLLFVLLCFQKFPSLRKFLQPKTRISATLGLRNGRRAHPTTISFLCDLRAPGSVITAKAGIKGRSGAGFAGDIPIFWLPALPRWTFVVKHRFKNSQATA
jgi:hypothetical protein